MEIIKFRYFDFKENALCCAFLFEKGWVLLDFAAVEPFVHAPRYNVSPSEISWALPDLILLTIVFQSSFIIFKSVKGKRQSLAILKM